jgi:hypothetical protein
LGGKRGGGDVEGGKGTEGGRREDAGAGDQRGGLTGADRLSQGERRHPSPVRLPASQPARQARMKHSNSDGDSTSDGDRQPASQPAKLE